MDKAIEALIETMPEETGKPLEKWKEILQTKGFDNRAENVIFLKRKYKMTFGMASTIVKLWEADQEEPEEAEAEAPEAEDTENKPAE